MGSRRGAAAVSAVLEAPDESVTGSGEWHARGPAPAGALQRGYQQNYEEDDQAFSSRASGREEGEGYVPRRGGFLFRWRNMMRSMGGRIVLGVSAFAVLAVTVVGFATVRYYLLHNPHFVIATSSDIEITGNEHLKRAEILGIFGADLERNIFKVPLTERRADLERLPWVAHATVMRLLPDKLLISITERIPVAFVRQSTQIGLVDASGVLLDMPAEDAGDPQYSFPVLTGLSASDPLSTRAARMDIYLKFMRDLDSTGEHFSKSLSEVDVSNPEDVKAVINSSGLDVLVHFGEEDFLSRYKTFEQHVPEWKQQYPKLAAVDMRYQNQMVLEMQNGANTPLAGDGTPAAVAMPVAAAVKPAVLKAKAAPKPAAKKVVKGAKPAGPAKGAKAVKVAKAAKPKGSAGGAR